MGELTILRAAYTPLGAFGYLKTGIHLDSLYTIECPWRDNRPRVSCIPCGDYRLQARYFNRGGYMAVEILGVPQRSHILIHVANTVKDLAGCIGVGFGLGVVDNTWAITDSRLAFERFMDWYDDVNPERITFKNAQPPSGV